MLKSLTKSKSDESLKSIQAKSSGRARFSIRMAGAFPTDERCPTSTRWIVWFFCARMRLSVRCMSAMCMASTP